MAYEPSEPATQEMETPKTNVSSDDLPTNTIVSESFVEETTAEEFLSPQPLNRPKQRRIWIALGLLGVGAALALSLLGADKFLPILAARLPGKDQPAPVTKTEPKAGQTVTVAVVETTPIVNTLVTTGTVSASDLLPILPKATGLQIKELYVDEGDYVESSQVVAILDNSVIQTQIDQAKAQVESARAGVSDREANIAQAEAGVQTATAAKAEAEAGLAQAQANLAKAQAERTQVESERERYQQLADSGAISQIEMDKRRTAAQTAGEGVRVAEANIQAAEAKIQSSQANIDSATARLESARAGVSSAQAEVRSTQAGVDRQETQLEQTLVRAPASGKIAERIARVGDISGSNQKLFTLIRNNQLELQAKVPETQLAQIKTGSNVEITSDADSRIKLEGVVKEVAPTVDSKSREATVKIDLPSSELLKPGMFLRAAITTKSSVGLTIPAKALLPQADGSALVYVLQPNNTVKAQKVVPGEIIQGSLNDLATAKIEIKTGLNPGDKVINSGAGYVKDGDTVNIVD